MTDYDVIVVGGGHAGFEAALASSRLGAKTILVTINADAIAYMPCNPAMGGPGKSQVLCELHSLGGMSALLSEETYTSIRLLNRSKGPSVQSVRIQTDRHLYSLLAARIVSRTNNLTLIQGSVASLMVDNSKIKGIYLTDGRTITSKVVVLSTGTYMAGRIHLSNISVSGGRLGQPAITSLSEQLFELGLPIKRFNTGTTPRVDARTIDYTELERQDGDIEPIALVSEPKLFKDQLPSYLGHTNQKTMDLVKKYMHLAPSVQGSMVKTGPRSCPSLEEKARWFSDRVEHLFFLEPESRYTGEVYLQGLYMSIPSAFQCEILKTLPGFGNVTMIRPGYAIDYDYIDPMELNTNLSTRHFENLFLAGQIDGTTGYDEAAALGLIAGANAALKIQNQTPLILGRNNGYIGVMIDDLTHKGVTEPYRITPSHVEYRLSLRADNAIFRLGPLAQGIGLLTPSLSNELERLTKEREEFMKATKQISFKPDADTKELFEDLDLDPINEPLKLEQIIKRSNFTYAKLIAMLPRFKDISRRAVVSAMVDIAFENYCTRERSRINDLERWEKLHLPEDMDYLSNPLLSKQARERLHAVKPSTLGEAMRIDGVTPSDLVVLGRFVSRETLQ